VLTVVAGPPCSGKSTYVRERAQPGDVVIDFDVLAQAFGSERPHDHNAHVRKVTMLARRAAIWAAVQEHLRGATVWIVDGQPTERRVRLYEGAHATVVTLGGSTEELHRRAARERPARWHELIDAWTPSPHVASVVASREW
jgi:predicted kinase